MKKILCYLFLIMFCPQLWGQSTGTEIILDAGKEYLLCDSLVLKLTLRNTQNTQKIYLKPDLYLVTHQLMSITMTNTESGKEHSLFLGTGGEIDNIRLTCENSILLAKDEVFVKTLNFSLRDFSPFINKGGVYTLELGVDYSTFNMKSDCCPKNIFKERISKTIENIVIRKP